MTTVTSKSSVAPTTPAISGALAPAQIGIGTKVLYGIGDIANAVKLVLFGLFTLFFYTSVMGLPGTLVGIATTVGLLWDAIIDPYIGHFSDRFRSRFGRRHLLMIVGALTMGVSMWLFFSPPQGLSTPLLFLWLLVTTLLVRTSTSIYGVPYFTLGAELSSDYHERTSITGIRAILAMVGTLAVAGLSFVLFFPDQSTGVDPKLNYVGYPQMGLVFGMVMTVVGLIAVFGTYRWRHVQEAQHVEASQSATSFFTDAIEALRLPSFRIMFLSFSIFFLAIVINSALSIHYLTYYAQIGDSTDLSSFQVAFYLGGIGGAALWLYVSRVVEKRWLYMFAGLMAAALMICASLFIGEGNLFGVGNVQVLRTGHLLGGIFGSIIWIMPWSMMADIADDDEMQNGARRQGTLFGIFFFGQQVASGVAVLMIGVLVDWFAGLVPGQIEQSALTTQRIGYLFGLLPAFLIVIAVIVSVRYPLNLKKVTGIQKALSQRQERSNHDN
jgi:glycoside/pentoside/hexuronide:cation symporter, GPH family